MSGDSVPLALSLSRLGTNLREATTLYQELREPLVRYLVCLGMSFDEAQDVVQDAFVSLHRHLSSGGSRENIRAWLFRVAHNRARNCQRSYERRFSAPLDSEAQAIADEASPERAVLQKEKARRLGNAIRTLTVAERECLLLRAAGLRYREIGEILQMPTSSVSDRVERAIRKLAEKCDV